MAKRIDPLENFAALEKRAITRGKQIGKARDAFALHFLVARAGLAFVEMNDSFSQGKKPAAFSAWNEYLAGMMIVAAGNEAEKSRKRKPKKPAPKKVTKRRSRK